MVMSGAVRSVTHLAPGALPVLLHKRQVLVMLLPN